MEKKNVTRKRIIIKKKNTNKMYFLLFFFFGWITYDPFFLKKKKVYRVKHLFFLYVIL